MRPLGQLDEALLRDECEPGRCPVEGLLAQVAEKDGRATQHLHEYLHTLPLGKVGVPTYYPQLARELADLRHRNLIYPVGHDLFVHILEDPEDARDYYVMIEPAFDADLGSLVSQVEQAIVNRVDVLASLKSSDERANALLNLVEEVCVVADPRKVAQHRRPPAAAASSAGQHSHVWVTPKQLEALKYVIVRDRAGTGVLEPLIQDPNIEDISCSGIGPIFIEHRMFGGLKTTFEFRNAQQLDQFVLRLAETVKRPASDRVPIRDSTLPDGSRINLVYGGEVSKRGSNFTIRKFTATPLSVLELVERGALDYRIVAYLSLVVGDGMSVFVCGETASGKTTLLNAITTFIAANARIVTIEDTPELQVPHPNWVRETVRDASEEQDGAAVDMFGLLKAALRQRPNAILVGEIRGEEGHTAFQAMQAGHAVMATFHAADLDKLIQRITGRPIEVPNAYLDNLNVVVFARAVRLPNGKFARRVTSVSEIIGYDAYSDSFDSVEVFTWNPIEDSFEFPGYQNSYVLEEKIAPRRGIHPANRRAIYGEIARRAELFEKLYARGVKGFHDLFAALASAQQQGLL